jgi:hypothetical protein
MSFIKVKSILRRGDSKIARIMMKSNYHAMIFTPGYDYLNEV